MTRQDYSVDNVHNTVARGNIETNDAWFLVVRVPRTFLVYAARRIFAYGPRLFTVCH